MCNLFEEKLLLTIRKCVFLSWLKERLDAAMRRKCAVFNAKFVTHIIIIITYLHEKKKT